MVPLRPLPLLSTMVRAPAASFICQLATGVAALAGTARTSTPASAAVTVSSLRRNKYDPLSVDVVLPGHRPRPADCRIWRRVVPMHSTDLDTAARVVPTCYSSTGRP